VQVPPSADYFAPKAVPKQLSQGDIFVCASGTVIDAAGRAIPLNPPPAPKLDAFGSVQRALAWGPPAEAVASAPSIAHETRWGLVMVISHECEVQKDFNALVTYLMRDRGLTQSEAEAVAQGRTELDPHVVVAPLLLYDEVMQEWPEELRTPGRLDGVRNGARLNYFPVRESAAHGLPLGTVVPLGRLATVERRLLTPKRHVASLAPATIGNLRYRIGRLYTSRDPSVLRELEEAVGQKIVNVEVRKVPAATSGKKKPTLALEIHLSDGATLHLEALEDTLTRAAPGGPGAPERVYTAAEAADERADAVPAGPPNP
jgi:hypothetical protein